MPTFFSNNLKGSFTHVDFDTELREKLADKGQAMPNGAYPIRNRADLKRAIQAFGRAKNKLATKRWIMRRARELDLVDLLPDSWTENLSHSDMAIDFIKKHQDKKMSEIAAQKSKP